MFFMCRLLYRLLFHDELKCQKISLKKKNLDCISCCDEYKRKEERNMCFKIWCRV